MASSNSDTLSFGMASSTATSLRPWSDYEIVRMEEEEDPFFFSYHLPSLEFGTGRGHSPLDWNCCFPFEQDMMIPIDPLLSMLDAQNNYPTNNLIQGGGIPDIQGYCGAGPGLLEEMGPIVGPIKQAAAESDCCYSAEEKRGYEEAVVAVGSQAERITRAKKAAWRREDRSFGSTTSKVLSKKAISQYFYMPITQAAKELNVGLTLLKKRCRELGIRRWPHRKLVSLQTLIKNVQELEGDSEGCAGKMKKVIEILEQERTLLEEVPDVQLEEKTKRLRQACFKANYKKRRLLGMGGAEYGGFASPASSSSNAVDYCALADGMGLAGYEMVAAGNQGEDLNSMVF